MADGHVELKVTLDDEATKELGGVERKAKGLARVVQNVSRRMVGAWNKAHAAVKRLHGAVFGLKGALAGLGIALGVAGLVQMGKALVKPNLELEKMGVSFKVLMGNAKAAQARIKELTTFAARTPFELPQVFNAARMLRVFGVDTNRTLRAVGDAASAAQQPIQDVAMWVGRLSSGSGMGEAIMRLTEMGIVTKAMFEQEGLKFNASGSLLASADEAANAVVRIFEKRYAGMMDEQSRTLDGMLSNLSDWWFQARAIVGKPLFDGVKNVLREVLDRLNKLKDDGTLDKWADNFRKAIDTKLWPMLQGIYNFFMVTLPAALTAVVSMISELPTTIDWSKTGSDIGKGIFDGIAQAAGAAAGGIGGKGGMTQGAMTGLGGSMLLGPLALWKLLGGGPGKAVAGSGGAGWMSGPAGAGGGVTLSEDGKRTLGDAFAEAFAVALERFQGNALNISNPTQPQPAPDKLDPFNAGNKDREIFSGPRKVAINAEAIEQPQQIQVMSRAHKEAAELSRQHWLSMYSDVQYAAINGFANMGDAAGSFIDSFADSTITGSERMQNLWQDIKAGFLRSIGDMVAGYIKGAVMQAAADRMRASVAKGASGSIVLAKAKEIGSGLKNMAVGAGEVAVNAYKWVSSFLGPFAIPAMIAATVAAVAGVKAAVGFADGGRVGGMGTDRSDNIRANLSRDEYVVNASAARNYGYDRLDAINRGGEPGGSGIGAVSFNISGTDPAGLAKIVEDVVMPKLEELAEQGRSRIQVAR